jgi:hypothetical protein
MDDGSLEHVPDEELLATVRRLTARSNVALADLLAHLGEVELRGIHRTRACASLYTYCIYELRMSEDAAFRRAKAARLVRRYPELREAIAKGEIHLTGVLMIGPHLGGDRHAEVLDRARFRSKHELLRLIAEIDPKPAVPARVDPLGPAASRATYSVHVGSLMGPVRELAEGARPADWIAENEPETSTAEVPSAEVPNAPSASRWREAADELAADVPPASDARSPVTKRPLQYKVQFTASQRYVDLLDEAIALLGHESPRPGLPDVQLRALEILVVKLRKERRGGSDAVTENAAESSAAPERRVHPLPDTDVAALERGSGPTDDELDTDRAAPESPERVSRPPNGKSRGRYVSRSVRRTVWARDGARCAYVDDRGVRCRETAGLEIHHRKAHALGGPNTASNLELRCTSHNALAAEEDFGREHLDRVRPCRLRIEA